MSKEPFRIHLTGYDPECVKCQRLKEVMPKLFRTDQPGHVETKSYYELFDKEKLIYLTPG